MKRIYLLLTLCSLLFAQSSHLQSQIAKPETQNTNPKLFVLIVVDQLPYEHLERFSPYFSDKGFNYLMKNGANFINTNYKYAYTKTACGHAAIATGTNPDLNGIVGNAWYDRTKKKTVNCVGDENEKLVGKEGAGKSPRTLTTYTLGDMLKLSTNFRSKVIGVSNKDRAAILTAGKFGTAYWSDGSGFVSSTYYTKELPSWVTKFNASGFMQKFFGKKWELLKPELAQALCDEDSNKYESSYAGMGTTFPHIVSGEDRTKLTDSYYTALETSPFLTEALFEFARTTVLAESLGTRCVTDMLSVGISGTDIIGHNYGPHSPEVFDNLLRTDAYLAEFLSFLDTQFGLYNCLIALSADHGIAPIPEYILKKDSRADAGRIGTDSVKKACMNILNNKFNAAESLWIEKVVENNIYINKEFISKYRHTDENSILQILKDSLPGRLPVFASYTLDDLEKNSLPNKLREQVQLSCYPPRCGDLMFVFKPYWILDGAKDGTNHGMPWEYDTHVPLIFFGNNITPGTFADDASPIDLAPTVAALLGIEFPASSAGKVRSEIVIQK
ncbi:MAG: alkaline phosphatase family protein [Ignavibacteriae bacterium]|nr:alkaline phosphatase family protein [Ignavibacteriota bacterium]